MQAKITNITKETLRADNSRFLDVEYRILDDGEGEELEVLATRKRAFALDATPEEIQAQIDAELGVYVSDLEASERSRVQEEQESKADETINTLLGTGESQEPEVKQEN